MNKYQVINIGKFGHSAFGLTAFSLFGIPLVVMTIQSLSEQNFWYAIITGIFAFILLGKTLPNGIKGVRRFLTFKKIQKAFDTNEKMSVEDLVDLVGCSLEQVQAYMFELAKEECLVLRKTGEVPKEYFVEKRYDEMSSEEKLQHFYKMMDEGKKESAIKRKNRK